MEHKHASCLRGIANGETDWMAKRPSWSTPQPAHTFGSWLYESECFETYRKPRTMLVNGTEVPAAETVAPKHGDCFWYPSATSNDGVYCSCWDGFSDDENLLRNRCLHLTEANAIAHAKALGWTE